MAGKEDLEIRASQTQSSHSGPHTAADARPLSSLCFQSRLPRCSFAPWPPALPPSHVLALIGPWLRGQDGHGGGVKTSCCKLSLCVEVGNLSAASWHGWPAIRQGTITMVLKVDLECERCNKKITRVLEKIKDKMNIKTIKFDEERNVMTISGPFDADKVRRKLSCEAGRIIKSMDVVEAPEEKKDDGGGVEKEEDGRKAAAAAAVDLRPLLKKMLEHPKPRTPCTCCCCGCSCGEQTTRTPAQGVPVAAKKSVCPAPASSVVSGHGYEAPPSYYGVPVYSIEGWY